MPQAKDDLIQRIQSDFDALLREVDSVGESARERAGCCEQWSVKDVLAHLDSWHEMFLEWERIGSAGGIPDMPAPGFTWKDTPALNEEIWKRVRDDPWTEVMGRLASSHRRVAEVVDRYPADQLFAKRRHRWTGSTSVGSYAVSATTSHYDWAAKMIRRFARQFG